MGFIRFRSRLPTPSRGLTPLLPLRSPCGRCPMDSLSEPPPGPRPFRLFRIWVFLFSLILLPPRPQSLRSSVAGGSTFILSCPYPPFAFSALFCGYMKILITGSSGLIGSEVALFLAKQGCIIHGVDNNQRAIFIGSQG